MTLRDIDHPDDKHDVVYENAQARIRTLILQYKRSCMPDKPKIVSVTLSPRGDWRMPSDAACGAWLEELEKIET